MDSLPPPEAATDFLAAPATRLAVEQLLARRAFEGGFILTGADGAGKATLAFMLAATILSGGSTLGETDPRTRSLIAAGSHPDVKVLRRTENEKTGKLRAEIDVEAARGVIERLHQTSVTGRSVVIVDLADELGRSASNSLLKILEEPPRGACLLLLSRSPSRLLPTLVSRCRRIALYPVATEPLAMWTAQRTGCSLADARTFAADSGGAPGRALRLAAGEGQEAVAMAEEWMRAVHGKADLLTASRRFAARNAERAAEEARDIILARLRRALTVDGLSREELARRLQAHDGARAMFAQAGTADPAQTAFVAGLAIRDALAGKVPA